MRASMVLLCWKRRQFVYCEHSTLISQSSSQQLQLSVAQMKLASCGWPLDLDKMKKRRSARAGDPEIRSGYHHVINHPKTVECISLRIGREDHKQLVVFSVIHF